MRFIKFLLILGLIFSFDMVFIQLGDIVGNINIQVMSHLLGYEPDSGTKDSMFYGGRFSLILFLTIFTLIFLNKKNILRDKIFGPMLITKDIKEGISNKDYYRFFQKSLIFLFTIMGFFFLATGLDENNILYNYKGFSSGQEAIEEIYEDKLTHQNLSFIQMQDNYIQAKQDIILLQDGVSSQAIIIFVGYFLFSLILIKFGLNLIYTFEQIVCSIFYVIRLPISVIYLYLKKTFKNLEEIETKLKNK